MPKNPLSELKKLITGDSSKIKTGTVTGPTTDGAWNIRTQSGAVFKAFGVAKRGDLVMFENDLILSRLKKTTAVEFVIK